MSNGAETPIMFCVVFWNIDGKAARSGIVRLVAGLQKDQDADVVALAECPYGVLGAVLRAKPPATSTTRS